MNNYLKTSVIAKMYANLNKYYLASYTCKVFSTLANWCRFSKTNHFITKYLHRPSYLKFSFTYEICSKGFQFADRLAGRINSFIAKTAHPSLVVTFIREAFFGNRNLFAYSLFILFFSCSYSIASILLGTFNNIKAIFLVLGLMTSVLLLVSKPSWTACRKNSLVLRIISYIFD